MFSAYFFTLLFTGVVYADNLGLQTRIVNGEDSYQSQFPFVVSVQQRGHHFCGGSILSSSWILMAAHCLNNIINFREISILAGTISLKTGGERRNVMKVIKHERFNNKIFDNDLALIQVSPGFVLGGTIQAVQLPRQNEDIKEGTSAKIMGWGRTSTNGPISNHLKFLDINVVSSNSCRRTFTPSMVTRNHICTKPKMDTGVCVHDSGGPLMTGVKQVGIVSYGYEKCANRQRPETVFTKVSNYVNWIKRNTGLNG